MKKVKVQMWKAISTKNGGYLIEVDKNGKPIKKAKKPIKKNSKVKSKTKGD